MSHSCTISLPPIRRGCAVLVLVPFLLLFPHKECYLLNYVLFDYYFISHLPGTCSRICRFFTNGGVFRSRGDFPKWQKLTNSRALSHCHSFPFALRHLGWTTVEFSEAEKCFLQLPKKDTLECWCFRASSAASSPNVSAGGPATL